MTYTLAWSAAMSRTGAFYGVIVDAVGGVVYCLDVNTGRLMQYALADGSETDLGTNYGTSLYASIDQTCSIRKQYVVWNQGSNILIYKSGALRQTIPLTGGYGLVGYGISWDAQYVVFIEYSDSNYYVRCYKGS